MKTSSRTLIGFGIALGALILVCIVMVLTIGTKNAPLLDENTPSGVVQRYLIAVQNKNYQTAYNYLAPPVPSNIDYKVQTFEDWMMSAQNSGDQTWKANLGNVNITGDTANVIVMVDIFRANGPLANPVNTINVTFLLKKIDSNWQIILPTDLYWLY
jgi:hypothetical protein